MASRGLCCILALQVYVGICFGEEVLLPQSFNRAVNEKVVFTPDKLPSLPYERVQWSFGNIEIINFVSGRTQIDSDYTLRVKFNNNTFALELLNLNMLDAGEYKLTVIKNGNSFFGTTSLNVFEPVSNVTITPRETELIEFNSTARLTCSASGSSLSFYWLNGSSELTVGGRVQLTDGNTSLTITDVNRDDIGPYRCGAFNIVSKDISQNLTLTIYYGPDKATVAADPVDPFSSSGCNITLRCSAESNPVASFQWAVNGSVLGEKGPELKLANIQTNQSGSYTCLAYNSKSLRYSTSEPFKITVLETISQVTLNDSAALLIEGSSYSNLTCDGSGTILTTKWMKDNKPLSPSNTIHFSDDRTVTIGPVRRSDSGEYQCTLSNPVSSDTAKYILTVNYGPDEVVIDGPGEVELEAKTVTFLCITESEPAASYTWEFNGTQTEVNTVSFTIELVDFTHSGNYTCISQNHVTKHKASGTHVLRVKERGSGGDGTSMSAGIIAAIVIGGLLVIGVVAGLVVCFTKLKGRPDPNSRGHKNIGATRNDEHAKTMGPKKDIAEKQKRKMKTELNHEEDRRSNNQALGNMDGANMEGQHRTRDMELNHEEDRRSNNQALGNMDGANMEGQHRTRDMAKNMAPKKDIAEKQKRKMKTELNHEEDRRSNNQALGNMDGANMEGQHRTRDMAKNMAPKKDIAEKQKRKMKTELNHEEDRRSNNQALGNMDGANMEGQHGTRDMAKNMAPKKDIAEKQKRKTEITYANIDIEKLKKNQTSGNMGGTNMERQHGSPDMGPTHAPNTEIVYSNVKKQ
ncbi:cell adhesion molecule CEACAM5-like isoform X3 [Brachyhypopomus gauderio]|uniref:cell adhesion molecule CEACAM5-like isoform X3 n=1 Tax=Brachyhypopomus gauderio TaxID=698409 RepID=UPI00404320D7